MSARVSIYKLFALSLRMPEATGFGRNKGSREVKRFYSSEGTPTEWRSSPTLYGYPVNTVTGQVQKQIVDALHLDERERASSLLSHIGYNKHMLIANNFVPILEYCTLAPDPLFAMEIWRTMEEKGINMNNECHTLVILALCKGGYLEEAFNLMSNYGETPDLYPTLSKYNTLLRASAKMRSGTHASKCLDLMERDMVGKNEITYGQLLKFFRKIC